jgi:hypothetical protein
MMNIITALEGDDLEYMLMLLGADQATRNRIYKISVWQDPEGNAFKFKINGGVWTPGLGYHDHG